MALAVCLASAGEAAPDTTTVTSFVAPSPPRTMPSASSRQTARNPPTNGAYSASPIVTPLAPFASSITQSFVDVSPSTVMALNVSSTASTRARCSIGCATLPSVVTNPSIVAIIGSIMPEPLAMPPIVTVLPPRVTVVHASFGNGSVVMIARAACGP